MGGRASKSAVPDSVIVGTGRTSVVFYPALQCYGTRKIDRRKYVSKLASEETIRREMAMSKVLEELDPAEQIAVRTKFKCTVDPDDPRFPTDSKRRTQSIQLYGGVSLQHAYDDLERIAYDKDVERRSSHPLYTKSYVERIIRGLYALREGVVGLNSRGFEHDDIHVDNIVMRTDVPATSPFWMRLIDLELSKYTPGVPVDHTGEVSKHTGLPRRTDLSTIDSLIDDFQDFLNRMFP
jgi:hypothetical protein